MKITLPLLLMILAQVLIATGMWYFFGNTITVIGNALLFPAMIAFVVVTVLSLLWQK